MARRLKTVQDITTTLKSLITFAYRKKLLSKGFRCGRFLARVITRKQGAIAFGQFEFKNVLFRIIAKGAGGGLGSGAVSSSRGAIVSTVIELHKDEEIYILVGQSGEHACIKSMGLQDESCASLNAKQSQGPKVQMVKDIYIDNGAGGGGGGSFVFLVGFFYTIPLRIVTLNILF